MLEFKIHKGGNSMAVQWLGLCALAAEGLGLIPGRGTKILQAAWQINQSIHKGKDFCPFCCLACGGHSVGILFNM